MKTLLDNPLYQEDLMKIGSADFIPWEALKGASLLLSGATGMIGSCIVDTIMFLNRDIGLGCTVYALTRNLARAKVRFEGWSGTPLLHFLEADVNKPIPVPYHIESQKTGS